MPAYWTASRMVRPDSRASSSRFLTSPWMARGLPGPAIGLRLLSVPMTTHPVPMVPGALVVGTFLLGLAFMRCQPSQMTGLADCPQIKSRRAMHHLRLHLHHIPMAACPLGALVAEVHRLLA